MTSRTASQSRWLEGRHASAQIVLGVLVATATIGGMRLIASSDPLLGVVAVLLVVGSLWLAVTRNTAFALAAYMLYLGLLDGYFKLGTGNSNVTLVRDALLYAVVAGLLIKAAVRGTPLRLPPLSTWVVMFVVIVLVEIANPTGGTIGHSIAGVRQHLEFIPLFFLGYAFVRTKRALRTFLMLLLLIAAANGVVSYIQFNLTPQQLSAWGRGYSQLISGTDTFSGAGRNFVDESGRQRVRPPALGSDAGSGGLMGMLAISGAIALVALSNRQRNRLIAVALAAGAVLAILTSQGRGALVASVVTLVAFGLLSATTRDRVRVILGAAAAALVCYLVISAVLGGTDSGSFRFQRLGPDQLVQSTNESRGDVLGLLVRAAGDYPLGAGLATGGPGAGVSGKSALSGTINTESELSYLVVETGILGLLIIVGFTLRLLILGFARCRREPDAETRLLIAAVVAPLAGVLVLYYPGVVTSSVPIAPYLWAAGGIVSYWLVTRQRMLRDAPPIAGGRETPVRPAPTPPERALAPPA